MASTTVNLSGNADIDGILSGVRWTGDIVTYGFPTAGSQYGNNAHDVDHDRNPNTAPIRVDETTGFSAFSNLQQEAAHDAFGEFARFTLYSALQATPANNADVRMAMSNTMGPDTNGVPVTTAYGAYPGNGALDGDVWFTPANYNNPQIGTYAYQTFFHEIGHALGLKHGHAANTTNGMVLPADHDTLEFSTMTYRGYVGDVVDANGYEVADGDYPQTFMMNDIAALQYMYGADYGIYSGNTTYRFDPATAQTFIDGVGQGVPLDSVNVGTNVLFRTIWDGNGYDTYDFSAYTGALNVNLAPGGWTDVNSANTEQAAFLGRDAAGTAQWARGQVFNALLANGDERSLIEHAVGGSGNDRIRGNQADNWLRGGDGNDVLEGFDGNDTLDQGGTFRDGIFDPGAMYGGNGNDTLWASGGAEYIDGGADFDIVNYSRSDARVVIDTTAGKVTEGHAAGDTLVDVEGIVGTNFNDTIVMGDGSNFISGGFGNDNIAGGAAPDSLYGSEGNDEISGGAGPDIVDGGAGTDTARFERAVVINLATGVHSGEASGDFFASIEQYRGGFEADTMIARSDTAARFIGGDGNDSLLGSDRDDWLQGGKGEDRLAGGNGFDMVSYADAPSRIVADLSQRDDRSQGKITAGDWGFDTLTSIEDVEGTNFHDTLLGDERSNKLVGLAGDDFINGRQGSDIVLGGAGNDSITCGDSDFAYGGEGFDTASFDGGAAYVNVGTGVFQVGGLGFYMTEFESYSGTAFDDFFSGSGIAETYFGGAGNDVMRGQGGNDFLYVDDGADVLDCGAGRDTVVFSRATVADWQAGVLDASIASDSWLGWEVIQGSAGNDRIRTNSWGYDVELRGGGGQDVLAAGNGNDTLAGEDADDVFSGGAGADTLIGGAGSDTLYDTAANVHGDSFADFGVQDVIDVNDLRFSDLRYDAASGLLEMDTLADGSFATQLQLAAGLQGEFTTTQSVDPTAPSTVVRLMPDSDGDGVGDFRDNAINAPNPDQRDSDGDGYGNVVDADLNQDLIVDLFDLSLLDERFGTDNADADFNGDGSVDLYDLSIMDGLFGLAPGPSAVAAVPPAPTVVAADSAEGLADLLPGPELMSHTMFNADGASLLFH